jgi:hypothetical protein
MFDLACGCKFDTELWRLSVSTQVSTRGSSQRISVTPIPVVEAMSQRTAEIARAGEQQVGFTEEGFISDETKPAEALTFWTPVLSCDECGALVTVHSADRHKHG